MNTETEFQETTNSTPEASKSKKTNPIIIAVLSVLLLGSLGYNIYKNNETTKEISSLNVDLSDTKTARDILQKELNSLRTEFSLAQGEIVKKDSILSEKDKLIFEKQSRIQAILNKQNVSERELADAQRLINSLNADIEGYKEQIFYLQEENTKLAIQKDSVTVIKDELAQQLDNERAEFIEKESVVNSTFSVSNHKITGLQVKKSGKEVETEKAKRIDKLRISFDLDKNELTSSGTKELFIAVYKPDGNLGIFKDASTGSLETRSGEKIDYSDKVQFNYEQGTSQHISFDWEDYNFEKGEYKIDIYQNGFKISQKSLVLR